MKEMKTEQKHELDFCQNSNSIMSVVFTGQTLQYPGSCRKYYLCNSDLVATEMSCCPGVYDQDTEACLPEDLVNIENICPSEDVCEN